MDYPNNTLGEPYGSGYPETGKGSRKSLKFNKTVAKSFKKRLKILAEAIVELDRDIEEREKISQRLHEKTDGEISHLEFVLRELETWKLGQVEIIETRRLGLERELFDLRQQKRSEYVRAWSDISTLKRKRREFIIEYENLQRTRDLIG